MRGLGAAALVGLTACTEPTTDTSRSTDTSPTTTGPCEIEDPGEGGADLGTGADFFEPLEDGDDLLVVYGPQGGYHVDGSVRVRGVNPGNFRDLADPDNPLTSFVVETTDGEIVSGTGKTDDSGVISYRQGLDPTCLDGVYVMAGRRIFLDIDTDAELDGVPLVFTVTVEGVDGVTITESHAVTGVPSPFND